MTTNKKLVVTVGVMAVALILALTGIIVVLVTANQRASSAVNVKYTASDVAVTLSATAYLGSNSHAFTKGGVVGGETELVLSPTVTEGSLSQTSDIASFDLSKTNDYVVFEYVFANNTDTIDVRIDQDGIPATRENINLTYTYSDTKITNFDDLEDNAEFTAQLLPAYKGEETVKYVYIKAQIADLLYDSSLVGDFGWALSKPHEADVNTVTLSVANSAYIERESTNMSSTEVTSDYTYRTLDSEIDVVDIGVYPAEVNKAFVGWSETEGGTAISTIFLVNNDANHNALRATSAKTLYPVYKDGNVPENCYSTDYDGKGDIVGNGLGLYLGGGIPDTITDLVIPDIASAPFSLDPSLILTSKIMKIDPSGWSSFLTNSTSVETVYMGRYVEEIVLSNAVGLFEGCDTIKSVVLPSKMTTIPENLFQGCTGLETFTIPDHVTSISNGAFKNCTGLKSVDFGKITSISDRCFEGCTGLENIDEMLDGIKTIGEQSFNNCTGITTINFPDSVVNVGILTGVFQYCTGLTSVTMSKNVEVVTTAAFKGCTNLTTVNINSNVTINDSAFSGCTKLTNFNVQDGCVVDFFGYNIFDNCTGLTDFDFSCVGDSIEPRMFYGCTGLTSIVIPSSVKTIYWNAFAGCTNLTSVTFENTSGWSVIPSMTGTVSAVDVTNPTTNVTLLTDTYADAEWGC